MDILIKRKSNELVIPETVNFTELVRNSNTKLSLNYESKMIDLLNTEFTEQESQWYITNLYIYMNYHPTNDYPINLENIFKMIGFANKGNAMKTIKSNFTKDEDYKTLLFPMEKQKHTDETRGGHNKENIMLNVDTFKNLCMLAKTDRGKQIRKYYVKLENIHNKIIKEEIEHHKLLLEEKETVLQETSKQLENKDKLLEEKDTIITNNEHVKKVEKHKFLIEKFKNKKCVYIAEIKENLIKIGSTKDINERCNGLSRTFGNCIFLDIFEHVDYQTVESNILINVKPHIYKEPINNHVSKEVVQLSNNFNYKQLRGIVVHCVNTTDFLSPLEILEKQKLDNESQKLNIIQELLNNGESLKNIIDLFSHNNTNTDVLPSPIKKEQELENKQTDTVNVSKQIINSQVFFKGKKPRGQKIHKIDPNNLQNIIKTYDSMVYLLRSPECYGYNKSGILKAISDSRIYKGYRWNFINKETMPTVEYKSSTPIRDAILQLNETKDSIIETFTTKDEAAKILGIAKLSMRNIIKNQEKHNNYYYIEYSKCPLNIIEKYDKPIFGINSIHAKKIKQINPITNTYIFFNNLNEIQLKLGISSKTIINSINNKTVHAGSLWEFA
jgi:phage anti-repressor protein/DNA-binding transcriptional MerR regulator